MIVTKNGVLNKVKLKLKLKLGSYDECKSPVNDEDCQPMQNLFLVRANCFCASLLRTQFHMPRHHERAR